MKLTIDKFIRGAYGLSYYNREKYLVKNALDSEIVDVKVLYKKNDCYICEIEKIIKKSDKRIDSVCQFSTGCGGCDLDYVDEGTENEIKNNWTQEMFKEFNKEIKPIVSVNNRYSNRVLTRVHIQNNQKGFFKNNSNKIIPIDECPAFSDELKKKYDSINLSKDKEVKIIADNLIVGGIKFFADEKCFFQNNLYIAEKIVEKVLENTKGKNVLDLYSGVGLFSKFFELNGYTVTSVEGNPYTLEFAKKNLINSKYINSSCEDYFNLFNKNTFDTVLLDPPRSGASKTVLKGIVKTNPKAIIYVSCDQATLKRDIKILITFGYKVKEITPYNMFPLTSHIETVCLLTRK